jgi:hypothetical protein
VFQLNGINKICGFNYNYSYFPAFLHADSQKDRQVRIIPSVAGEARYWYENRRWQYRLDLQFARHQYPLIKQSILSSPEKLSQWDKGSQCQLMSVDEGMAMGNPKVASIRRTEIFISAASADLKGTRALVKRAVDTIGCHGVYQEEFPPDYRKVEVMLLLRGALIQG